jgi:hypothetical protein
MLYGDMIANVTYGELVFRQHPVLVKPGCLAISSCGLPMEYCSELPIVATSLPLDNAGAGHPGLCNLMPYKPTLTALQGSKSTRAGAGG